MSALADFLELRGSLATAPVGDGGIEVCHALADALDTAIVDLAGRLPPGVAVVAIGGYGRRHQCLYSDVDLTILHEQADTETLARRILYPLWDAGLKVGHAFRTLRESLEAGRGDFETLTSQLSSRLIAGESSLLESLTDGLGSIITPRRMATEIAKREEERRRRHPHQVMAANLKQGRGGLRTFQGADWERTLARLLGDHPDEPSEEETRALNVLLSTRNALHAVAGRAHDTFTPDVRDRAAQWLGTDTFSAAASLCSSLALGDRLAEIRWPEIVRTPADPSRRVFGLMRGPSAPPEGNQLSQAAAALTHPQGQDGIWTPAARDSFVRVIGGGAKGRLVFNRLRHAGWLDREFPEWTHVTDLPQLAPFHEHPTDAHMWRTADEMTTLLDSDDPLISSIVASIGADDQLLLAAFLHDIGKGRGGDHSEIGASVAEEFLTRTGFGGATTRTIAAAIRDHLLLMYTATRRDIWDPDVITDLAHRTGDLRTLQVLYVLSIADARATGPTMWSDWKQRLLDQLYGVTAERLSGVRPTATPAAEVAGLSSAVVTDEVQAHLTDLPEEYAEIMSAAEIAWHLDSLDDLTDHTHLSIGDSGREVLAVGRDRRGFLLAVCRAFAAHGVGIRDARIFTRSDGVAIDTFVVHDDVTGGIVPAATWTKVAKTLEGIEAAGLDVSARVAMRASAYTSSTVSAASAWINQELTGRHLALEVRAPDRIGLLADLVEVLYAEGLDLRLARIDTRGDEAIDILYLDPVSAPGDLDALCERIRQRLKSTTDGNASPYT